jgi:hypothetical protein
LTADLTAVSSGFIARLDFGELARWGRKNRVELTLALLVLGVLADDANDTLAMDHLALVADRFYGRTDLHWYFPSVAYLKSQSSVGGYCSDGSNAMRYL